MINTFIKWPSKAVQSCPKVCLGECRGLSWVSKWEMILEGMGGGATFFLFSLWFLGSSPMETLTLQVYFQLGPRTLASCQQKLRGSSRGAVHQPTGQLQDWCARHRRPCRCQVGKSSPVFGSKDFLEHWGPISFRITGTPVTKCSSRCWSRQVPRRWCKEHH